MFSKRIKPTILSAVVLAATVAGASALFVSSAQAVNADSGTGSAYGLEVLLGGTQLIPPTPTATLGANGESATSTAVSLPIAPLVTVDVANANTSSQNFGAANEAITSTGGVTGDLTVDGVNLLNALGIQAVTSDCASAAIGSSGSATIAYIGGTNPTAEAANSTIPVPPNLDAVVASIEANVQTISNAPGATSISVVALQVTLLAGVGSPTGLVQINGGESSCGATGPDINVSAPTISATNGLSPTSGPTAGGTTVTITGTNFITGDTSAGVAFGGTAATNVTVTSPTTVTAVDPAHAAGPVAVTFADKAGVATSAQLFTYVAPAGPGTTPPTVVGISPTSGPPGGGETVTIGGTNLCGATAVYFGTTPATITGISSDCTTVTVTEPPGVGTVQVTITTPGGTAISPINFTYIGPGYWEAAADGGVFSFGDAKFFGSVPQLLGPGPRLNSPIVTMADTPDHGGYWLFAADGGVFAFGDAKFFGSVPGVLGPEHRTLNGPIVAAQASPDGLGYRMFAADGGVFDFGDALFTGSLPGSHVIPPSPITAAASAPIGQGYWLVSSNGGVYSYGSADANVGTAAGAFFGKVVALGATPTGKGLYLFLQSGAVGVLGDATGGLGGGGATSPIVFGEDTSTGKGYWEFSANGTVSSFGDAPNLGSSAGIPLAAPITSGIAFGANS